MKGKRRNWDPAPCLVRDSSYNVSAAQDGEGAAAGSLHLPRLRFDPAHRVVEQTRGVLELELLLDAAPVNIHRFGAQIESLGNLFRVLAAAKQAEHFKLPI